MFPLGSEGKGNPPPCPAIGRLLICGRDNRAIRSYKSFTFRMKRNNLGIRSVMHKNIQVCFRILFGSLEDYEKGVLMVK